MGRSEFIMEVRRWFVNPGERRLRAGWRVLVAVFVIGFATVLGALGKGTLDAVAAGLAGTVAAALVLAGWLVYYGVQTGTVLGLAWLLDARRVRDLGLSGDWWPNLAFGLVLGAVMTTAVFAVELAAGLLAVEGTLVTRAGQGFPAGLSVPVAFLATAALFVAVGISEELLLRGYLMTNAAEGLAGLGPFDARRAVVGAGLLTAPIFGFLHATNPSATLVSSLNITAVGLFFAWAYAVTGDLGIPVGVHVTWNLSLSAVWGFPVSGLTTPVALVSVRQTGPATITGGAFGPEGGAVLYLALAVAVAGTWWWVRRTTGAVTLRESVARPNLRGAGRPGPGDGSAGERDRDTGSGERNRDG